MNKNLLLITTIFIVVISYIFNIDDKIKTSMSYIDKKFSTFYLDTLLSIESTLSKYFNQLNYIEKLEKENKELVKYKALYNITSKKNEELETMFHVKQNNDFEFYPIKVLSNYTLYKSSILKLEPNINIYKNITPIVTKYGYSAGIVIKKQNNYLAYLNSNEKCNYSVFIGDDKSPGITSGMDKDGKLIIKHIPKWQSIKIDDEIITSGMDNIFPFGIKVAKVVKIIDNENTKTVLAKSYAKILGQRYFYTIKSKP